MSRLNLINNSVLKIIMIFIFSFLSQNFTNCQNIKMIWEAIPTYGNSYKVVVNNKFIKIKSDLSKDSIIKEIAEEDFIKLMYFFNNNSFPIKGNTIKKIIKEYYETVFLEDSNWILLNGDSLRSNILRLQGFYFDPISKRYYKEIKAYNTWTHGTDFKGIYKKNGCVKEFKFYSARISEQDYQLNNLIKNLVKKYDTRGEFNGLLELIESYKPK